MKRKQVFHAQGYLSIRRPYKEDPKNRQTFLSRGATRDKRFKRIKDGRHISKENTPTKQLREYFVSVNRRKIQDSYIQPDKNTRQQKSQEHRNQLTHSPYQWTAQQQGEELKPTIKHERTVSPLCSNIGIPTPC